MFSNFYDNIINKLYFCFLFCFLFINGQKKIFKSIFNLLKKLWNHVCKHALKLYANVLKNLVIKVFPWIVLMYCAWLISPLSSLQKDLTGIGTLFGGTAALLGIFWARDYWKETRQLAATELLSLLREFIDKTNEIILKPDLYQYEGYYPFNIPELQSKEKVPYDWTRPSRLISNEIGTLKINLYKPLSRLAGKEYYQILELFKRLEKVSIWINGWLQVKLGNRPEKQIIIHQYTPDEYQKELKSILEVAEKLLFPVITKY